jgi:hypothetical protein
MRAFVYGLLGGLVAVAIVAGVLLVAGHARGGGNASAPPTATRGVLVMPTPPFRFTEPPVTMPTRPFQFNETPVVMPTRPR